MSSGPRDYSGAYTRSTPKSDLAAEAARQVRNPPPAIVQPAKPAATVAAYEAEWKAIDARQSNERKQYLVRYKASGVWKQTYDSWRDACEVGLGITQQWANKLILLCEIDSPETTVSGAKLDLQPLTVDSSSATCDPIPISAPKSAVPPPPKTAEEFERHHAGNDGAPVVAKKGKPEPEAEPETSEPSKDDLGRIIPQKCLPLWQRAGEVQKYMTSASTLRVLFDRLQEDHDPLYAPIWAHAQEGRAQARNLFALLRETKPERVCPECDGKNPKCGTCFGVGLVSSYTWKHHIIDGTNPVLAKRAKGFEK